MPRLILICGPTAAGKTTHSISVSKESDAVKFSIDPWMQTLFAADMTSLDYTWMIERIHRCYEQIWEVSKQILQLNGNVVLDLGFTTKEQRDWFSTRAIKLNINAEIHYLQAPKEIRKKRLEKRNMEKDPTVFAFEVTDTMFDFMEPKFEIPSQEELQNGCTIDTQTIDTQNNV